MATSKCFTIIINGAILLSMVLYTNAEIVFREEPRDTTIVNGQPVFFHCIAEDSSNIGGNIVIEWRHENSPIQQGQRVTIFPNGTLHMALTQSGDEGSYSCLASLVTGSGVVEQRQSVAATLYFAFLDPVFLGPSSQSVIDKQTNPVWFQCISGNSRPPSTITWEKDGVVVQADGTIYIYETPFGGTDSLMTSGTLQINSVGKKHEGRYQCLVHNPMLPNQVERSQNFTLTVNPNPGEPYVNVAPTSQIIPVGQDASFACSILGDPQPQLTWNKVGNMAAIINTTTSYVLMDGTLYFPSVQNSDEGSYVCTGSSRLGSVSTQAVTLTTASMDWTFGQHPSDVEVIQDSPVTLTCRPPYSKPRANVTWYKDNQEYTPRSGAAVLDVGDLYFSAVTKQDEGEYFCIAANDYIPQTVTSDSAILTVRVGAMITEPPVHTEVTLGGDLTLTCVVAGDPSPSVYWYKDTSLISAGDRVTIGDGGQLLHIINVIGLDQGTYKCAARNDYGYDEASEYVDVLIPPQITTGPGSVNAGMDSSAFLTCHVIGDPLPMVTWFKDQTFLNLTQGDNPKYQKTNQGLHINNLALSDTGNYKCVAENKVGLAESSGRLTVEIEPIMHGPPTNKTVNQGVVVYFTCEANGIPPPTLNWEFNGGPMPAWASVSNNGQVLTISSASQQTMGRYTCIAQNNQGAVRADAYLTVKVIPVIQPIEDMTLESGQQLVVSCVASGTPAPSFQWLKGQDVVIPGSRISFAAQHILVINNLLNDDQGDYSCVASNSVGSTRESFELAVVDIPGQPFVLEAIPVSATSIRISWVAGGDAADSTHFQLQYRLRQTSTWVTYADNIEADFSQRTQVYIAHGLQENQEYEFQVYGVNTKGSSSASNVVLVSTPSVTGPSRPRNFQVIGVNATAAELQWEIPEQRSGPIDIYVVEYFKKNTNDYASVEVPANDLYTIDVTVTGLQPVTSYLFRVCSATLYNGQRQWGNYTAYIEQLTLPGPPGAAPESVVVEAISPGSLQVNWMQVPADHHNGVLLGHDVFYKETNSTNPWQVVKVNSSEGLSSIIPDLKPWTQYDVKVRAYNAEGVGPFSSMASGRSLADAPTSSPVNVVLVVLNQTAISVTWEAVPTELRLGPIDGYTVSYQAEGSVEHTMDISSPSMAVTLKGLLVATTYFIQVAAYNNVTNSKLIGPTTAVESATTLDGVPGRVNNLEVRAGPGYLFLQWDGPLEPNGNILGYVIEYRAQPDETETEIAVTMDTVTTVTPGKVRRRRADSMQNATYGRIETSETWYNLTGLQPDMRFWVTIAAKTSAGISQDVIGVYAVTDPALPTKETSLPEKPDASTTPAGAITPPNKAPALPYPLSSIIIFVSAVALAGLALILAMVVILVWCRGREDRKAQKRANLLLPNEQTGSQAGSSRQPSEDFIMDTSAKTPSSLMEATRLSTSIHTIPGDEYGDLSQMDNGPLDPSRPRALSSPPINHLLQGANGSTDPVVYAESGPSTARINSRGHGRGVQGRLYAQAKSPRHNRYQQVNVPQPSAEGSDTTPEKLEDLYSKVTRSSRGPNRMKKDSLAAIAVLLDEEEEGSQRSGDSSSVVIANQRTTL